MKVLIITYYWPPAGGSGVQRWLKFVKYMVELGVTPVLYIPKNPSYPLKDESLLREIPTGIEVLEGPIFEPNQILGKSGKQVSSGQLNTKPNFFQKCLHFIRANYFIPDARKFWVRPSVKFLKAYLSQHPVDLVVTTGPPHSLHLIGLKIKEQLNLPWIADFRDPWTEIDYFHQLPLTRKSRERHQRLEREVVQHADQVLVVGKSMRAKMLKYNSKINVVSNGFDDFNIPENLRLDTKFSIVHIGQMNADRNPIIFWNALKELISENKDFSNDLQVRLIGSIAPDVQNYIQTFHEGHVKHISYLNHEEVRAHQCKAQVLLLSINKVPSAEGIVTGKIFEYLQAKRPILAIGPPNGDAAEILNRTNTGVCIDFDDQKAIKNDILALYKQYKKGLLEVTPLNIERYHRRELTKNLVKIMKNTRTS